MHILFLDHQGVMRRASNPAPGTLADFDRDAVSALNQVLDAHPDLQLVVSSDWKLWCNLEEMQDFYREQGVQRVPVDMTPFLPSTWETPWKSHAEQRAREIMQWLSTHVQVDKWIAVDDLCLAPFLDHTCTIHVDPKLGLAPYAHNLAWTIG